MHKHTLAEKVGEENLTTPANPGLPALIEIRFYVPLDTEYSFQTRSSQPVSWLGTQETKPNTTKASKTGIKCSKLPHEKHKQY